MSKRPVLGNSYVPPFPPDYNKLPWYERDLWHILIILIIRKWPTIPQNILRTNSWSILILFTTNVVVINYKIRTNIIRQLRRKILKITLIRKKRNFFWCV